LDITTAGRKNARLSRKLGFFFVKIADKRLEKPRHLVFVLQKIAEAKLPRFFVGQKIVEQQFANVEQKTVKLVVAVQLDAAKNGSAQIDFRNFVETMEQQTNLPASVSSCSR